MESVPLRIIGSKNENMSFCYDRLVTYTTQVIFLLVFLSHALLKLKFVSPQYTTFSYSMKWSKDILLKCE